jgi:hypothetical protein
MVTRTDERRGPYVWALATLAWLGFAVVAVGGGIFRVVWLEPRLGERLANITETLMLAAVLGSLIWIAVPWLVPGLRHKDLNRLGLLWVTLTLAFEFLFGHFVDGASWAALFANYDIAAGRLWILIPLLMGLGPRAVEYLQRRLARLPADPEAHAK